MDERQASVLTESQREFLRGEADISAGGERKARQRIRERVREGVLDLALLAETLPETQDFGMIFDDFQSWNEFQRDRSEVDLSEPAAPPESHPRHSRQPPENAEDGREMTNAIHGAVAFFWLAVSEYGGGDGVEGFESVAATAISMAETTPERRAEVDVDVEVTHRTRPTETLEKFEAGEPLTEEEFQTLVEEGEVAGAIELLRRVGVIAE